MDTLEKNTEKYIKTALESYVAPELSEEQIAEMRRIVLEYGLDETVVKKIEDARG